VILVRDSCSVGNKSEIEGNLHLFEEGVETGILKDAKSQAIQAGASTDGVAHYRHFCIGDGSGEQTFDVVAGSISIVWIDDRGVRHEIPHP
jgi:hypothetical protein